MRFSTLFVGYSCVLGLLVGIMSAVFFVIHKPYDRRCVDNYSRNLIDPLLSDTCWINWRLLGWSYSN